MAPISELDKIIFELNKNLKANMMKIAPKSLGEHASFQDYMLKQLHGYNFGLLGEDGERNTNISIFGRVKLDSTKTE